MKVLIVYDSFFGNTEKIAQAMYEAIKNSHDVILQKVQDSVSCDAAVCELFILGSPTRAFNPTKAINSFIKKIPNKELKKTKIASFDTRIDTEVINNKFLKFMVKLFGYAAKPMNNKLIRKGGKSVVQPEGFFVKDSEGPLQEGELKRAAEWVRQLVQ